MARQLVGGLVAGSMIAMVLLVVAALYGAYSANERMFVVQGLPALSALVALFL